MIHVHLSTNPPHTKEKKRKIPNIVGRPPRKNMIVALEHIILHLPHVFDAAELWRDELAWI